MNVATAEVHAVVRVVRAADVAGQPVSSPSIAVHHPQVGAVDQVEECQHLLNADAVVELATAGDENVVADSVSVARGVTLVDAGRDPGDHPTDRKADRSCSP
jgi:hypothetical protein